MPNRNTSPRILCALLLVSAAALAALPTRPAEACTGVTLKAKDGAVLFGRTLEWGSFDLHSRIVVVPRGYRFSAVTPDGKPGFSWDTRFGAVGVDAVEKDFIVDGLNETGLAVNVFYHPGSASYQPYDPAQASASMGPLDVCQFLLTTCQSVDEARRAVATVRVVPVLEPAIGIAPPIQLIVTEPNGTAIVIEFIDGQTRIHEAPLGVITNSPTYDWHMTNLRNYVNLSAVALPEKAIEELDFKPLGGGSGMIGLPGDFTPPSRFVRAVAFSQTARPTASGDEAVYELFRILDNFNVPLGSSEGTGEETTKGMRSATLWTTVYDTKNLKMYYHTAHNRRVRMIDLGRIDFDASKELRRMPMEKALRQDVEDVTPR